MHPQPLTGALNVALTTLGGWNPVVGLVVDSYQGCSEAVETRQRRWLAAIGLDARVAPPNF